jgi:hypothetical protein
VALVLSNLSAVIPSFGQYVGGQAVSCGWAAI